MNEMTRPGPGKFEGNESLEVSEMLYSIIGDGMQDDEIGDVESFGWHALITDADKNIPDDFWPLQDESGKVIEVQPAYIVLEDNYGFFSYRGFDLNTQARNVWKSITQEYLALMDETDGVSVL
jgi:hypothetical protein